MQKQGGRGGGGRGREVRGEGGWENKNRVQVSGVLLYYLRLQ